MLCLHKAWLIDPKMTASTQQWGPNCPTSQSPEKGSPAAEKENLLSSALQRSPSLPQRDAGFLFCLSTASPEISSLRQKVWWWALDEAWCHRPHPGIHTKLLALYWRGAELCIGFAWGAQQGSISCWTSDHRLCLCKSLYLDWWRQASERVFQQPHIRGISHCCLGA